jgi:MFS family permease
MFQKILSPTRNRAPGRVAYLMAFALWQWAYMPPVLRENAILRKFQKAQFISYAGTWLQLPAISILVYEMTGSSAALTVSVLLGMLPNGIISFLGGHLADRYPTRNLLLGSNIALAMQAGILCVLHMTGYMQIWHLYALQTLSSAIRGISEPAQAKYIVELAGKKQIKDALAVNAVCWNITWIGVPPLAGFIIGQWGVTWPFLGNAISYYAPIMCLLRLKAHAPLVAHVAPHALLSAHATTSKGKRWKGIRYIVDTPVVWLPLLIASVAALFNTNGSVLQPLIGMSLGGVHGYTMISASNGVGCLLGAFILLRLKQRTIRGLLISTVLMSALLIAYGLAPVLALAMAMIALSTISAEVVRTSSDVLIQSNVPLELQGRVSGINQGIAKISVLLSNMFAGFVLVPASGPHNAQAGSSAMTLPAIVVFWVIFRRLDRAGKLEKAKFKEVGFE